MGFFENFPFTNFHELNLDWVIRTIKSLVGRVNNIEEHTETYIKENIETYIGSAEFTETVKNYVQSAKFELTSMAVCGDSNSEGFGWWKGVSANKTIKNDGYCAVFREWYPDARIDNYSVSGSTLASRNIASLSSQIDGVIASGIRYQYVLLQSGYNDIVSFINQQVAWHGYAPVTRVTDISAVKTDNSVGALITAILRLQEALPDSKIYFVARENNYGGTDPVTNAIQSSLFYQLFKTCEVYGVPVINLQADNITSLIAQKKAIYYFDDVHWNETAYRTVIAPYILGVIGNLIPTALPAVTTKLYNPTTRFSDIFTKAVTMPAGMTDIIAQFFNGFSFEGEMIFYDKNYAPCKINFQDPYAHMEFTRLFGNYRCIINHHRLTGDMNKYNVFNDNSVTTISNDIFDSMLPPQSDITQFYSYDANSLGWQSTKQFSYGPYIKDFENLAGQHVRIQYGASGSVDNVRTLGGMLTDMDIITDNVGSGIYYIPTSALSTVKHLPPNVTQGGILIVARNYFGNLGFLLYANTADGIYVAPSDGNWVKKA